jgi:hypothetical protein
MGQAAPDREGRPLGGLARLLDNPLVGFAPWVLLSLVEGPGRLTLAAALALGVSVVFVVVDKVRGRSLKLLSVVDVVSFVAFLVVGMSVSTGSQKWLETWFGEISNIILVVVVAGSVLARSPFTIQYAREEVDPALWDQPLFIRINYMITAAWGVAFLVSAIAGFCGDAILHNNDNLWTSWIIQIGADVVAVRFTSWYPDYAEEKAALEAGESGGAPPSVSKLFLPLAGYITPVGVVVLIFDGGPTWVGIALIVAGALLSRQLAQRTDDGRVAAD